jgi:hypothetical protein
VSAARDREHDEWIPWYVEDTPGWLELTLVARGAMEGIARKLNRKTGKLTLRRGLSSLAVLLHVRWEELEPALAELVAKGKVEWDGSTFTLSDPDYLERKRRSGADRVADLRARRKSSPPPDVTDVTLPALPPLPALHVTDVTPVLVSSSLISSDSDLGSDAREGDPPPWFATAVDVVAMGTGVALPVAESWLRYDGHREGKGLPRTAKDAQYWLTTVMVPEVLEVKRRDARDGERTKAVVQQRSGPEVKPLPSVAPLMRERARWEQEAATPEQSAEAAANLRKLLGKVGS